MPEYRVYVDLEATPAVPLDETAWTDLIAVLKTYPLTAAIVAAGNADQAYESISTHRRSYDLTHTLMNFEIDTNDASSLLSTLDTQAAARSVTGTTQQKFEGVFTGEFQDAAGDEGYTAEVAQFTATVMNSTFTRAEAIAECKAYLDQNVDSWQVATPYRDWITIPGRTFTNGGNGGTEILVTNLNDSGAGSLREALETPGRRIIHFNVSGEIALASALNDIKPHCTVDGSTAPGVLYVTGYQPRVINTHDVQFYHMRFHRGPNPIENNDTGDTAIVQNSRNIWFDQCSFYWSRDEVFSVVADSAAVRSRNVAITNSIIAEALRDPDDDGSDHPFGSLMGYHTRDLILYRNIYIHCGNRVPSMFSISRVMVVNNFSYNTENASIIISNDNDLTEDGYYVVVGCKNKSGPDTSAQSPASTAGSAYCLFIQSVSGYEYMAHVYFDDLRCIRRADDETDILEAIKFGSTYTLMASPYEPIPVDVMAVDDAETWILANAGATLPSRSSHDTRVLDDYTNVTGAIIDLPSDVGGL